LRGVSQRPNPDLKPTRPLCSIPVALPRRESLESVQPDLLARRRVGMQRLRNQTARLERQTARLADLVVVPIPHLTKLELQLLILLLEMGNLAGRLSLGRRDETFLVSKRLSEVEYALA